MSSLPSPQPGTIAPSPSPVLAPPRGEKPRRTSLGWIFAAVAVLAAAGWYWKSQSETERTKGGTTTAVRTAVVGFGSLDRTVRITGTVQAERFAALMAPQMSGSRSGRGRGGSSSGGSSGGGSSVSGGSTTSSGQNSTSSGGSSGLSAALNSSMGGGSGSGGSAASSNTSSLGARRGTTNRFSSSTRSSSGSRSGGGSAAAAAASGSAMGSGLGSTGGQLFSASRMGGSGGPGGSGGGDFMLVLTSVAKAGGMVKKGDVVAEFDRQYQLLRLDDYRASITQWESRIKKLKADQANEKETQAQLIRAAKAEVDKAELDLKTIVVRSAIEAEKFKLNLEEAKARLKQVSEDAKLQAVAHASALRGMQIDLDQSKIELQRATNNVDRMVVKAPIDGLVVMQTIWRGGEFGQVQQGDQVYPGMFFMSIVDPSSMVVNATVNQVDGEALRIGMKANVSIDAYPGLQLPATIFGMGAMTKSGGFAANWVREIPVRLRLEKMDSRVIPDLSASADVVLASEQQVAYAPLASVFRDGSSAKPYVFVRDGVAWRKREVETGLANHVAVAVKGLNKGEVLAAEMPPQPNKS